jgi:hypothetical protein
VSAAVRGVRHSTVDPSILWCCSIYRVNEPNPISLGCQASLCTDYQFYVYNKILIRSRPPIMLYKYLNPVLLL